ncbi:signal peptidase I [Robertmurraya mangrovi]|uniref:signal peptidase I n=1 Tax=Robertmurraya mangrovi TaxID=3098077 RepID=UPI002ACBDFA4|nr:signal peptidase I [Bacillus sp. 31A1R]
MVQKVTKELFSWVKALALAIVLTVFISVFVLQPYKVSGSSMEPTFQGMDPFDGGKVADRVMVFKSGYLLGSEPEHGDIVIIDSELEKDRSIKDEFIDNPFISWAVNGSGEVDKYWIKRVVGKAGDKLEFNEGKVYRNGELLDETYIKEDMDFPFETVVVPDNHVFVMGDNRNDSLDSREIGPVPVDHVVGEVFLRYYPIKKINKY